MIKTQLEIPQQSHWTMPSMYFIAVYLCHIVQHDLRNEREEWKPIKRLVSIINIIISVVSIM